MRRRGRLCVTVLLCATTPIPGQPDRTVTGTLYARHGGEGGGVAHLCVGHNLMVFAYDEETKYHGAVNQKGFLYGAIWQVTYHTQSALSSNAADQPAQKIDGVTITGRFDTDVLDAGNVVRSMTRLLANKEFTAAMGLFSSRLRRRVSVQSLMNDFGALSVDGLRLSEISSNVTEVLQHHPGEVIIKADFLELTAQTDLVSRIRVVASKSGWRIDDITKFVDEPRPDQKCSSVPSR